MKQLTLFSLLFAGVVQTFAQQAAVTGPDSRLKLDFQLQDGKPVYSVTYDGKTVLENSPLGIAPISLLGNNAPDYHKVFNFEVR